MLKPGDIVTDRNRQSRFYKEQGQVQSVQLRFWEPPEVLVLFPVWARQRALWFDDGDDECFLCQPEELRLDQDWQPEVYANRYFGGRWHSVSTPLKPLDPSALCRVEGCPQGQRFRVWINIWGSVYEVFLCAVHARHYRHFSCMDSFPFRGRISA